jgi:O-antigen/teichoic acid export membrane protein
MAMSKAHWHSILRLKLVLSVVYAFVVFGVARLLGFTASWNILLWLILNNILISWITLFRSGISGMARYKMEAIISVMDKVLMILICGSLFFLFAVFKIEWFIWAQTVSLVITLLMAAWISKRVSSGQRQEKGLTRVCFHFKWLFRSAYYSAHVCPRSDSILIKNNRRRS